MFQVQKPLLITSSFFIFLSPISVCRKKIIYDTIKIDFFELCFLPVSLSFPPFMMSYVLHRLGKILNFMWENGKKKKKKKQTRA